VAVGPAAIAAPLAPSLTSPPSPASSALAAPHFATG